MPYYWGVDSAAQVTLELLSCVRTNYGEPQFWGRYLTTVAGASEGLTKAEGSRLHGEGIRILPIYNAFRQATGTSGGRIDAQNAIYHAMRLGIPKDKVIFANVERFFTVDEGWIRGWVERFYPSGYRPGFYHDPTRGSFASAFCEAASKAGMVLTQSILWSAEPEFGAGRRKDAPEFKPKGVPCGGNLYAWQYGRDAKACPIDTNLIDSRLYAHLW